MDQIATAVHEDAHPTVRTSTSGQTIGYFLAQRIAIPQIHEYVDATFRPLNDVVQCGQRVLAIDVEVNVAGVEFIVRLVRQFMFQVDGVQSGAVRVQRRRRGRERHGDSLVENGGDKGSQMDARFRDDITSALRRTLTVITTVSATS